MTAAKANAAKTTSKTKTRKGTTTKRERRDAYAEATNAILAALERGTIPWRKPWSATRGVPAKNVASGKVYRGVNFVILAAAGYESPWWGTFKQVKDRGGCVRKGEHGTAIVFWGSYRNRDAKAIAEARAAGKKVKRDDTGEYVEGVASRVYTVFNAAQCDGLDDLQAEALPEAPEWDRVAACDEIVSGYVNDGGPKLREGGTSAHYNTLTDVVQLPDAQRFASSTDWYAVGFHELGHSTGAESRLNRRDLTGHNPFGSQGYAREELTAELTAALLCAVAGIDAAPLTERSAAYIANWQQAIGDDPRLVVVAAQRAQHAADLILGDREIGAAS